MALDSKFRHSAAGVRHGTASSAERRTGSMATRFHGDCKYTFVGATSSILFSEFPRGSDGFKVPLGTRCPTHRGSDRSSMRHLVPSHPLARRGPRAFPPCRSQAEPQPESERQTEMERGAREQASKREGKSQKGLGHRCAGGHAWARPHTHAGGS